MTTDELTKLLAAASPRPWRYCEANDGRCPCGLVWAADHETCITDSEASALCRKGPQVAADGVLIAAAINALPALLVEVKALREVAKVAAVFMHEVAGERLGVAGHDSMPHAVRLHIALAAVQP